MSVPELGTYTSEDKSFTIKITSANADNGQIDGSYKTDDSPEGSFTISGQIGHYSWVYSESQGTDGVPPFNIRFSVTNRPDNRHFCIYDTWTGAYRKDNTLLLEGARSFVNLKGDVQVRSLGTMVFSR